MLEKKGPFKNKQIVFLQNNCTFRLKDKRHNILVNCEMPGNPHLTWSFLSQQPLLLGKKQSSDEGCP